MKLLIMFDIDADIIDVPAYVLENRELLRKKFLKWLTNKSTKHEYWVYHKQSNGQAFRGLCYRGDAFVEWLNRTVIKNNEEKASVYKEYVSIEQYKEIPAIYL